MSRDSVSLQVSPKASCQLRAFPPANGSEAEAVALIDHQKLSTFFLVKVFLLVPRTGVTESPGRSLRVSRSE